VLPYGSTRLNKPCHSSKLHFACDALGYPLDFILTTANTHDYHQAKPLLQRHLRKGAFAIMDKGYDGDTNRTVVSQLGGIAVIARNAGRASLPGLPNDLAPLLTRRAPVRIWRCLCAVP